MNPENRVIRLSMRGPSPWWMPLWWGTRALEMLVLETGWSVFGH